MPERIQRKRIKGWRMPPNTIYVGRPTKWGNPFKWQEFNATNYLEKRRMAAKYYQKWLAGEIDMYHDERDEILDDIHELAGKNLACWCPPNQFCHADVLLRLANHTNSDNFS